MRCNKILYFVLSIFILFTACSEKQAPQTSAEKKSKQKLILINKQNDGNYYTDTRTQAQVFVPQGLVLDLKNPLPSWSDNFKIKTSKDDFKIYIRFDAVKDDEQQENICKAVIFETPIANLDSKKLKLYPFLKGEFNADIIVTTDKVYSLQNEDPTSPKRGNIFQIRKKNLGCYTLFFIYDTPESLVQHSTEKEILEYVRFE